MVHEFDSTHFSPVPAQTTGQCISRGHPRCFTVTPDRIDHHGDLSHHLELIRRDGRRLIRRDDVRDELSPAIPYGTNFDEPTRTLPETVRADAERGRDLGALLRADPRLAIRFDGKENPVESEPLSKLPSTL